MNTLRSRIGAPAKLLCGIIIGSLLLEAPVTAFAAEPKGDQLIQIGVEVVEVDNQKTQNLGIEWLNTLHIEEIDVPSLFKIGTLTRSAIFADVNFLLQDGAADLLANPKLVTREGTSANFHAGGEIPYIVSSGLGSATVEFKPYGVTLQITPKVDREKHIVLTISAEVSAIDPQTSVTLSGNTVPGILTRKVNSELTLEAGSTLALAGLIQSQKQWTRDGIPGLMNIPFLGYLFSHKVSMTKRTSIIVFVTPTLLEDGKNAGKLS